MDELEALSTRDAPARAKRASELMTHHQDLANEYSRVRKEAVADLVSMGWTHRQIGELLGMSRTRAGQLVATGPPIERALLGAGELTVAIGGKPEGPKKTKPTSTMVSAESSRAYELISESADAFGLRCRRELVPPPGLLDLNRPNLIVIGSPRLLPLVGQMLASDQHLGFGSDDAGWYLVNKATNTLYRSPADDGDDSDYAYLGRVPRPDGQGVFLYLAGIHAPGTLGAALHLTNHISEIYAETKTRRFSALVRCHYDSSTSPVTIETTELASPIYVA